MALSGGPDSAKSIVLVNTTTSDEINTEFANLQYAFRAPQRKKYGVDLVVNGHDAHPNESANELFADAIWQAFAILLPVQTVGVMGDKRTYEFVVALRVVESTDGMTANWVYLSEEVLSRISNRICNEVHGVNRVVLDITNKPPSTIEWE